MLNFNRWKTSPRQICAGLHENASASKWGSHCFFHRQQRCGQPDYKFGKVRPEFQCGQPKRNYCVRCDGLGY